MNLRALRYGMIVLIVGSYLNCLYEHSAEMRRSVEGTVVHTPLTQCGHDESGCFCRGAVVISVVRADHPLTLVNFWTTHPLHATPVLAAFIAPLASTDDGSSIASQGDTARSGRELRTRLVSLLT